ncbi:hypothetical protein ZWY2020_030586 [Hordeum vulgare]|nr:hypothetical protein ZWY2020_030586 [Hordeum vulgare]
MPVQQHSSSLATELGVCSAMSLEPAQQHRRSVSSSLATELGVCAALSRLDPIGGGAVPVLPTTLLDEYERQAIEAQLSRAVLRRSYSEPSLSCGRTGAGGDGRSWCRERRGGGGAGAVRAEGAEALAAGGAEAGPVLAGRRVGKTRSGRGTTGSAEATRAAGAGAGAATDAPA